MNQCGLNYHYPVHTAQHPSCRDAAKSFIRGQTGLDDEQIDAYEDITIAVLVLTQDMYDNRRLYVEKSNVNKVVDSIIYQYAENWL